ncbi:MAG: protein-glutamate O-methyltransferase CheR [Thermodesulfobacteriota bacterium]|nr:protein-glutamate O-methyltransferase CheR [Thermodesulfobacteriota bacterium]
MSHNIQNENLEIRLLLEAIHQKYGYNFKDYANAHTKRRLRHRLALSNMESYTQMIHRVIYDEDFFNTLLMDLSINVTEMFRDPWFYKKVREDIMPFLKTYSFIKVWHAGCSAGQEVYSISILLEEEGMKHRSQIYATDFNEFIIEKARNGIYPIDVMKSYTVNYQQSGGKKDFSDYYTADYDNVIFRQSLKEKVLFSSHNLVTDGVFGEMNLIFCRNVLIYFNRQLQNRVLKLFYDSLCPGGYLCLGSKESLKFTDMADKFESIAGREKIYRKKREP